MWLWPIFREGAGLAAGQAEFAGEVGRRPGQFPLVTGAAELELAVGNAAQVDAADLVQSWCRVRAVRG